MKPRWSSKSRTSPCASVRGDTPTLLLDIVSIGLDESARFEASEANEHVDDPAIREDELVVDRVELAVEGHRFSAVGANWYLVLLDKRWRPTEAVTGPDLGTSPFETWESGCRVVQRFRHQPEGRYLRHVATVPAPSGAKTLACASVGECSPTFS